MDATASAGARPASSMPAPDRRDRATRDRLVGRLEGEFREMPGLQLTTAQAARLLALTPDACSRILAALAARGVLRATSSGHYVINQSRP